MKTRTVAGLVIAQLILGVGALAGQQNHSIRTINDNGRRIEVEIDGNAEFTDDSRAVESLSPGSRFQLLEDGVAIPTRRVELLPAAGGGLDRRYWVNGVLNAFDAAADRWFQDALRQVIQRTSSSSVSRSSDSSSSSSSSVTIDPTDDKRCTCVNQ